MVIHFSAQNGREINEFPDEYESVFYHVVARILIHAEERCVCVLHYGVLSCLHSSNLVSPALSLSLLFPQKGHISNLLYSVEADGRLKVSGSNFLLCCPAYSF